MKACRGVPSLLLFALVLLAGPAGAGFWADPELKDILLAYTGDRVTMKAGSFVPYLVEVDPHLQPRAGKPLFDTFLFLPSTFRGMWFINEDQNKATARIWQALLDDYFGADRNLAALAHDLAGLQARGMLAADHRIDVLFAIPYPPRGMGTRFGDFDGDGRPEDMSQVAGQCRAIARFIGQVVARWQAAAASRPKSLRLAGFYWFEEGMWAVQDAVLVPRVRDLVRQAGHRFFWIPACRSLVPLWSRLGLAGGPLFDGIVFQPNYIQNYAHRSFKSLDEVFAVAHGNGFGVEIEWKTMLLPGRIPATLTAAQRAMLAGEDLDLAGPLGEAQKKAIAAVFRRRFTAYLDAAFLSGLMPGGTLAYYLEGDVIRDVIREDYGLYRQLADFLALRGAWRKASLFSQAIRALAPDSGRNTVSGMGSGAAKAGSGRSPLAILAGHAVTPGATAVQAAGEAVGSEPGETPPDRNLPVALRRQLADWRTAYQAALAMPCPFPFVRAALLEKIRGDFRRGLEALARP